MDAVKAMMLQESTVYLYERYESPPSRSSFMPSISQRQQRKKNNQEWREKICYWTYSVIDHFNLSRETVAISMNFFDRYLATRGNECDGDFALLTSLTTLYLAIKLNEKKKIKLETLTALSRGNFKPKHIEAMELKILTALSWHMHPPTVADFIIQLLHFIPEQVRSSVRHNIFELSRYFAELSVCDSFFMEQKASTIAFSAILNVLEQISFHNFPAGCREKYLTDLFKLFGLHMGQPEVIVSRRRLLLNVNASDEDSSVQDEDQQTKSHESCSIANLKDLGAITLSDKNGHGHGHCRSNSSCGSIESRTSIASMGTHTASSSYSPRVRI